MPHWRLTAATAFLPRPRRPMARLPQTPPQPPTIVANSLNSTAPPPTDSTPTLPDACLADPLPHEVTTHVYGYCGFCPRPATVVSAESKHQGSLFEKRHRRRQRHMRSSLMKPQEPKSNLMQLECPHCAITHSSRGIPFTQKTLHHHIRKRHPAGENKETKPDKVLTCEICGCWKSRRGTPFMTESELSCHRRMAHRALSSAARNGPSKNHVKEVQTRSKARQQIASIPVKFCPQCGCNVEVIAAALSFFA